MQQNNSVPQQQSQNTSTSKDFPRELKENDQFQTDSLQNSPTAIDNPPPPTKSPQPNSPVSQVIALGSVATSPLGIRIQNTQKTTRLRNRNESSSPRVKPPEIPNLTSNYLSTTSSSSTPLNSQSSETIRSHDSPPTPNKIISAHLAQNDFLN